MGENPKWQVARLDDIERRGRDIPVREHLGIQGTSVGWMRSMDAVYDALDFDILVAPLRDTRFNASKSEIKVLECAARGIPTVASDVGPYRRYIRHGRDGFLVDRDGWYEALRVLCDTDAREALGRAARERAASRTYEVNAGLWEDAYAALL